MYTKSEKGVRAEKIERIKGKKATDYLVAFQCNKVV